MKPGRNKLSNTYVIIAILIVLCAVQTWPVFHTATGSGGYGRW